MQALLVGQTCNGPAQESLGGVGHALPPGRNGLTAGVTQVVLVVDEQWRSEFLGQLEQIDAADVEVSLPVHRRGAWEELALQRCGRDVVVRRHGQQDTAAFGRSRESKAARRRRAVRPEYDRPLLLQCPPP